MGQHPLQQQSLRGASDAPPRVVQFFGCGPIPLTQVGKHVPVRLVNLRDKHLNETLGVLGGWHEKSERFEVLLPDNSVKLFRPSNLTYPMSEDEESSEPD